MSGDLTSASPFAASLAPEVLAELKSRGTFRVYAPGQALFHELQATSHVVLIDSGRVKVVLADSRGRETLLAFRSEGDLIGEQAAIDGESRSATILSVDEVHAYAIAATEFTSWLDRNAEATHALLRLLSNRLRDANRKRAEHGKLNVAGRISSRLVELGELYSLGNSTDPVAIPLTQEELAGWVGASREATVKALSALRSEGAIRTQRRAIVVLDTPALRRRAELSG